MTNNFFNTSDSTYISDIANGNRHSPKKDIVYFSRLVMAAQKTSENSRQDAIYQLAREVSGQTPLIIDKVADMLKKENLCSKCDFKATVREIKQNDNVSNNSKDSSTKKIKQPTDDEIFNRWLHSHPNTAYGLGAFRRYENSKWPTISEKEIMNELFDELVYAKGDENVKPNYPLLKNITELAKVLTDIPENQWDADFNLLPCKNGVLRLDTRELLPPDPSYHFTSRLEIEYDPLAKCPNFINTLESTIPNEKDFIQDFFGYCLTAETKHEIALVFVGPPGCGKSTILSGLSNVLGPRAGYLGISDFEKSNYSVPLIIGKTALISTEQPVGHFYRSDLINKLISGETIRVERKYEPPFFYKPIAKFIWAVNEYPKVLNAKENGLSRRLKLIKFPYLEEKFRNVDLKDQIKNESAGILNFALDGKDNLTSNGRFIFPPSVVYTNNQFIESNDQMAKFIIEKCNKGAGLQIQSNKFNEAYSIWCNEKGFSQKSSVAVSDELMKLGFSKHSSNGRIFWIGLDLKV